MDNLNITCQHIQLLLLFLILFINLLFMIVIYSHPIQIFSILKEEATYTTRQNNCLFHKKEPIIILLLHLNKLPIDIKQLNNNKFKLKKELTKCLLSQSFYV